MTDPEASGAAREDAAEPMPIEHLSTSQCWALVEATSLGRLAIESLDGMPDVFPVNYMVHGSSIYIRSAPGSKLMAIVQHPVAAFEIDGEGDGFHWSVVLRGAIRRLSLDNEIRESGVKSLVSESPTAKFNYICVTPRSVTGRRFADRAQDPAAAPRPLRSGSTQQVPPQQEPPQQEPTQQAPPQQASPQQAPPHSGPRRPGPQRPVPIPHFSPWVMPADEQEV